MAGLTVYQAGGEAEMAVEPDPQDAAVAGGEGAERGTDAERGTEPGEKRKREYPVYRIELEHLGTKGGASLIRTLIPAIMKEEKGHGDPAAIQIMMRTSGGCLKGRLVGRRWRVVYESMKSKGTAGKRLRRIIGHARLTMTDEQTGESKTIQRVEQGKGRTDSVARRPVHAGHEDAGEMEGYALEFAPLKRKQGGPLVRAFVNALLRKEGHIEQGERIEMELKVAGAKIEGSVRGARWQAIYEALQEGGEGAEQIKHRIGSTRLMLRKEGSGQGEAVECTGPGETAREQRKPVGGEREIADGQMKIWVDGSFREGRDGGGAWGVLIRDGAEESEASGFVKKAIRNERMEMRAAIEGMKRIPEGRSAMLYTDSEYVVDGLNVWSEEWKKRGWHKSSGKRVRNRDLWRELLEERDKHEVEVVWVRGHSGDEGNKRADRLARNARHGRKATGEELPQETGAG